MRTRLGLPENHRGRDPPFSRVVFYEALLISLRGSLETLCHRLGKGA